MAKANYKLVESLRNTAESLKKSTQYQWGHMGSCNCGFLAQEVAKPKIRIKVYFIEKSLSWAARRLVNNFSKGKVYSWAKASSSFGEGMLPKILGPSLH